MGISKKDYLKTLENSVVVLGNGFDLHCGLHSSYEDYFKYAYKKHLIIHSWFELFQKNNFFQVNDYHNRIMEYSIWDVFFALNIDDNNSRTNRNWCDIEQLMLSSFISNDDLYHHSEWNSLKLLSNIDWNQIKDNYVNGTPCSTDENQFVCDILRYKAKEKGRPEFYDFLLEELKHFEADFGRFIEKQIKSDYLKIGTILNPYNSTFFKNVLSTIKEISTIENISRIDTFNYSYCLEDSIAGKIHHINGDVETPIFGIDSIYFESSDPRFVFTKTCRRMDADTRNEIIDKPIKIQNIIIYGHSLDEADFNYFFPLFDKIQLTDPQSPGVVVYAFSIYNQESDLEIRTNVRNRITNLFREYAKSKNGAINPERFLDSLTTQGKVVTVEIKRIEKIGKSVFDEEWEDVEEKYKFLKQNKNSALF